MPRLMSELSSESSEDRTKLGFQGLSLLINALKLKCRSKMAVVDNISCDFELQDIGRIALTSVLHHGLVYEERNHEKNNSSPYQAC